MSRIVAPSNKPVWTVLVAALIFHTGLISLQSHHRFDMGFVRVWILDSLAPVEKLADRAFFGVRYVWGEYIALIHVRDENLRLDQENGKLRMQLTQQREEVLEAQRVRALASLQDSGIGKSVVARVIGRDPARTSKT